MRVRGGSVGSGRLGRALLTVAVLTGTLAVAAAGPFAPDAAAVDGLVATSIAATSTGACAATEDEEVWCWGEDWNGFPGNGSGGLNAQATNFATSPVRAGTTGVQVATGCALRSDSNVQCWGFTGVIEDGDGSRFSDPFWGSNTPHGYGHALSSKISGRCALHLDGTVSCQGWDNWGQIGRGGAGWPGLGYPDPAPSASQAVIVSGLNGVVDLSSHPGESTCAVKDDGTVWCWGWGADGRLGDGRHEFESYGCGDHVCTDYSYASTPVQVAGVTDAVAIDESCIYRTSGAVSCWGRNASGRFLTDVPTSTILTPTEIPWLTGAVDIEVNRNAVCAAFADGSATCQGRGLLGDGADHTTTSTVDVDLTGNGKAVEIVAVASDSWCVRYVSGRVDCWGDNTGGELGVGFRSSFSQPVLSPTLVVGFTGRDLITGAMFELGSGGNTVKEGEATTIRLRVENLTETNLTNVSVVGTSVTAVDVDLEGAATIGPLPAGESLDGGLGPRSLQQHLDFADFSVNPTRAGTVRLAATVTATGTDGSVEEEVFTYDLVIEPAPLLVELTARAAGDDSPHGAGDTLELVLNDTEADHDNRFEVEVRITNQGEEDVETIDFLDPEAPIDFDSLRVDDDGVPIPGVAISPRDSPRPELPADDLGPGESMTQTYRFEATDEAHALLSTIVEGRMGDDLVTGRGTVEVKVLTDVLIEFGMRTSRPGPYVGGHVVRFDGVLRNISQEETVGVAVYPTTEGNAGNGNVFPTTVGRTPTAAIGFVLPPETSIDLQALLVTTELPVASDGSVSWQVRAYVHEVDETTGEVTKLRAPDTQIKVLDTDRYDDEATVRIEPAELLPDVVGECAYAYFGCGVLVGLDRLGTSLFDLARMGGNLLLDLGNQELRLIAWAGQMLGEVALMLTGDEVAFQHLVDEVTLVLSSLVEAGAITIGQGVQLKDLVHAGIVQFVGTWVDIFRTGDLEQLQFELGRIAGENPDIAIGLLASGKAAAVVLRESVDPTSAIRQGLARRAATRQASFGQRLAAAEREQLLGGTPVIRSGVYDAGDPLALHQLGDYWAADPRDVQTLWNIADAEEVAITFGSRIDELFDAVRAGRVWPAPRELQMLPVDDLDVVYLGYRPEAVGRYELVSPPFGFDIDVVHTSLGDCCVVASDEAVARAAREWVAATHPGLDPVDAERVAMRLQARVEEYAVYFPRYASRGALDGPTLVTLGDRDGLGLVLQRPVGATANRGAVIRRGENLVVHDERVIHARHALVETRTLPPDPTAPGTPGREFRRHVELTFDATGDGDFRPMTGGIELLAVTNLDGTRIVSEAKRRRVYEQLQSALGMSNGELPDFVATGRAAPMRDYVVGGETAVTVGPGREARASYFVERASVLEDSPNAAFRAGEATRDFVVVAGLPNRWVAVRDFAGSFVRASRRLALLSLASLPSFFVLNALHRVVTGLDDAQVPNVFTGEGVNVRPDGDGGLEAYDPGEDSSAPLRAATTVGAASSGGWVPISVDAALALGADPETLELAPATVVVAGPVGATTLEIAEPDALGLDAGTAWFEPGDDIVIDPGGPNEERATVAALGSLVLTAPLAREHIPGEYVVLDIPGPTGGVTPEPPTPPGPPGPPSGPPAVPPPPPSTDLCAHVPDAFGGFLDIAGTGNSDVIECLAYAGITTGRGPGSFDPSGSVTRGQLATFIARALDLAHGSGAGLVPLPADAVDAFSDDDGLAPHEASIDRLAAAGIVAGFGDGTFRPEALVTRAQLATFLNNAQEHLTGERFAGGEDRFDDDDGLRPHEANIDGIAAAGIAQGVGFRRFDPSGTVSRNQMASFLVRWLAVLHEAGSIDALPPPTNPQRFGAIRRS